MGMTADDYRRQLAALLPPGPAWPRAADTTLGRLLAAFADEFARVDARAADLLEEIDPRTTIELIADWERVTGLPDACVNVAQTLQERRNAVVARLTALGGAHFQYWIDLAASLGFTAVITDSVTVHHWELAVTNFEAQRLSVGEGPGHQVGEPLRSYGADDLALECLVLRLHPAHAVVTFTYGATGSYSVTYTKELLDAQNR